MVTSAHPAKTIDHYIASFPKETQVKLEKIRQLIRSVVTGGEETISYQIPAIKVKGKYVIYFAAYKQHIGMYPLPVGPQALLKEIAPYVAGKGTLRFPLTNDLPLSLIKRVVEAKYKEALKRIGDKNGY